MEDRPRLLGVTAAKETREEGVREDMGDTELWRKEAPWAGGRLWERPRVQRLRARTRREAVLAITLSLPSPEVSASLPFSFPSHSSRSIIDHTRPRGTTKRTKIPLSRTTGTSAWSVPAPPSL